MNISFKVEELTETENTEQYPLNIHEWSFGLELWANKKRVARLGKVKSAWNKEFDVKAETWFASLDWDTCLELAKPNAITYQEISKFPAVKRDISMMVQTGITFAEIEKLIRECAPKLIQEVELFDVYKSAENAETSYALSITLLDKTQTLTDATIQKSMDKIFAKLEQTNKIVIRK